MPNESIVDQFTAQVERFVRSPHVNEAEPVARFVAAVAPRETKEALDTYEWLPGGFFLLHRVDGLMGDEPVQAVEIIGYEASSERGRRR
jgi:hypothetical protein